MAALRTYKCENCDFTIGTQDDGRIPTFLATRENFLCTKCSEVFRLTTQSRVDDIDTDEKVCPKCGNDKITRWDPISCRCPKCNGKLVENTERGILYID